MAENIVGSARIEILPDVSKFAAQVQSGINAALKGVTLPPIGTTGIGAAGTQAGTAFREKFTAQVGQKVIPTAAIAEAGQKAGEQAGVAGASGFVKGFSVLGGLFIARRIFQFLGGALQQAVRLEDLGKQTAAAIASTGGAAAVSAEQVAALSQEFERLTTIQEETITDAQNVLLTFTRIRGDVFRQAVEAAADLGVALSGAAGGAVDLHTAAIQVGKALNDPIRGLLNLRRVGVQFTDEQERQIRAFIKAGDVLSAQKIILRELQVEFGNSAKALGEGLGGATRRASDAIGDFTRGMVEGLAPVIKTTANVVTALVNSLNELPGPIKGILGGVVGFAGVGVGLAAITIAAKNLRGALVNLLGSLAPATGAIAAQGVAAGTSTTLTAAFGTALKGLALSARAAAVGLATLLLTVPGLGEAILLAGLALKTFKDNAGDLGDIVAPIEAETKRASDEMRALAQSVLEGSLVVDRTATIWRDFDGNVHTAAATLTQAGSTSRITAESLKELDLALQEVRGGWGLANQAVLDAISSFDAAQESVESYRKAFDATIGVNLEFERAQNSVQDAVANLKRGLLDSKTGFEGLSEAARDNRENLLALVGRINLLNEQLILTGRITEEEALAVFTLQIQNLIKTVPGAARALGQYVTAAGLAAVASLRAAATVEILTGVLTLNFAKVAAATATLGRIDSIVGDFNTTITATPAKIDKVSTAAKKTEEKIHPLIAAFTKLKDATSLFNQFLDATTGKVLNQLTATANFQEAIDALGQSLLDNGATFNATTEQGRSNINALVSAVQAAQGEVAALVEAGKIKPTTAAEKAALETRIESLKRTFPEAAALIDRILAQLDKIPGKAKVGPIIKFQVDTKVAEKARKDLAKDIEAHVIFKFFKLTPGGVIPVQIITKAQQGALLGAGQTALVGEAGPELITPRQPVQVHSNAVLTRLLAAMERIGVRGDRGPAVGQINVLAGRTPVETAIEIARRLRAEQFLSTGSF